ncbi:MAG TPA: BON domain-containing protein, partial [Solimonas sp.]|nr:BON domain-containing protein [Solimonas sp.]
LPLLLALPALPAMAKNVADLGYETQIYTLYATHDQLRPLGLSVDVEEGRATLTGTVQTSAERELAERIASGVEGVVALDNRLQVDADRLPDALPGRREPRGLVDWFRDATLLLRIKTRLMMQDITDAFDIDVEVWRGRVRLRGVVDRAESRDSAERIAQQLAPDRRIDNRILLRPADPAGEASARLAFDDLWITARVKSLLWASRQLDGQAIDVATSDGMVRLSGRVDSAAQRDTAVAIARGVRGVREVRAASLTTAG